MKGQFMLISAIVVGIIVISVSAAVETANEKTYSVDDTPYMVENIKQQASLVEDDEREVDSFIRKIESLNSYNSDVVYWGSEECFNMTMIRIGTSLRMSCIG